MEKKMTQTKWMKTILVTITFEMGRLMKKMIRTLSLRSVKMDLMMRRLMPILTTCSRMIRQQKPICLTLMENLRKNKNRNPQYHNRESRYQARSKGKTELIIQKRKMESRIMMNTLNQTISTIGAWALMMMTTTTTMKITAAYP